MPTIHNLPYECGFIPRHTIKPSVVVTCSGCRKNTKKVIIPYKGNPNIFQCLYCEHKMIIFGFGTPTGAFVAPLEGQPPINKLLRYFGDKETVSNNFCFEVIETLSDCYPE